MGEEEHPAEEIDLKSHSDNKKKPEILMTCSLIYSLSDDSGDDYRGGEACAELYDENIKILPFIGEVLIVPYREMTRVNISDYKVGLLLDSGEELLLSSIGLYYEDFCRNLTKLRNEMLLKDMLMNETIIKPGIEADYNITDPAGSVIQKGICDARIYETAVVIIPEGYDPIRIPYSIAFEIKALDYEVLITLEDGSRYRLFAMGREYDHFRKCLSDTQTALSSKTQTLLKGLFPSVGASVIRRASRIMVEGRAAKKSDIESISPELWDEMEKRLKLSGIYDEYEFLKSVCQMDKISIGIKRGLMGELTGEYIWFLAPIYSLDPARPGNVVIMEASAGEGGGKATYLFRMTGRAKYKNYSGTDELHDMADAFLKMLNYCMLAVNFRREPIYLSNDRLKDPKYISYKTAVSKLEPLRILRSQFLGRVIHSSFDKWKQDIMDLISFNVTARNDDEKYIHK